MKTKLTFLFAIAALALLVALTVTIPAASKNATPNALPTASAEPAADPATPEEHHPHIRAALQELREARHELKEAAHDFGGHRAEALEATDNAIRQLEICLKYDKH